MRSSLALLVMLAACTGSKPPEIDASAPPCTMALYDKCSTEHDCMSGVCQPFMNGAFIACTQACTPGGTACPADSSGQPGTCTATSFCQPAAPNNCRIVP